MPLNISKGNMYPFVSHTWNAVKGKCPHDCEYCYMKIFKQNPIRLDEKEFKTNLGKGNFIFVGSSTDMWADDVSSKWIANVLGYCATFKNKYLFQTKNPKRFSEFMGFLPSGSVLACTIETNYGADYGFEFSKAPPVSERLNIMTNIKLPKMISIEPIMDFDLTEMVSWIKTVNPEFVSVGADSKHHNLPEPSPQKVERLIVELQNITNVVIKDNLQRLRLKKLCTSTNFLTT